MTEDLVEIMARAIDPSSWRVMDRELAMAERRGPVADPEKFKAQISMCTARNVLRAIEGAGMKVVGRDATEEMIDAMGEAYETSDRGDPDIWQAAFDAALAFGGEE